jgi:hypothetical protein
MNFWMEEAARSGVLHGDHVVGDPGAEGPEFEGQHSADTV